MSTSKTIKEEDFLKCVFKVNELFDREESTSITTTAPTLLPAPVSATTYVAVSTTPVKPKRPPTVNRLIDRELNRLLLTKKELLNILSNLKRD